VTLNYSWWPKVLSDNLVFYTAAGNRGLAAELQTPCFTFIAQIYIHSFYIFEHVRFHLEKKWKEGRKGGREGKG
jgi:hypothetical protein